MLCIHPQRCRVILKLSELQVYGAEVPIHASSSCVCARAHTHTYIFIFFGFILVMRRGINSFNRSPYLFFNSNNPNCLNLIAVVACGYILNFTSHFEISLTWNQSRREYAVFTVPVPFQSLLKQQHGLRKIFHEINNVFGTGRVFITSIYSQ